MKAVYNSLNADRDDLAIRAAFQQRLKLLLDHAVLGSTLRTRLAGPRR